MFSKLNKDTHRIEIYIEIMLAGLTAQIEGICRIHRYP